MLQHASHQGDRMYYTCSGPHIEQAAHRYESHNSRTCMQFANSSKLINR